MASSAARSITRLSATKASGSKTVPAHGLTDGVRGLIMNAWKHSPLPLIGGGGKVLPVFLCPLLCCIRQGDKSEYAFGFCPWLPLTAAQDAPQGHRSSARSQVCSDTAEARHTRRRGRTDARRGFPALTPAHGSLQHGAGSCSGAKEKPISALDKSTERAV